MTMIASSLLVGEEAVANFLNQSCATDGVNPTEPLFFTCEIYETILLRVMLPTGDQETISKGDQADDVALPPGFSAVSLDIYEIEGANRYIYLTLLIANASLLKGGYITCDDTSSKNATARCPVGKLSSPSNF